MLDMMVFITRQVEEIWVVDGSAFNFSQITNRRYLPTSLQLCCCSNNTSAFFFYHSQWFMNHVVASSFFQAIFSASMIQCSLSFTEIKAPGMSVLKISLMKPSEVAEGVSVWEWSGSALDEGAEAAKWFSDYLGKPSQLVRFNAGQD